MFALVDCNAFYVSCERVFQPHLEGKPVIVLSSNDGCAISRSNEAKALGIKMGVPLFKIKDIVQKHKVHVFSSNFSLYGDMSSRVMATLKTMSSSLEIYSVDEAFLDLSLVPQHELFSQGCHIKTLVKQWTGIPVSVGIGPTKTLAKVANHMAKKNPSGCCVLADPQKIEEVLKTFPLQDIWGIGYQWSKKLSRFGMNTALDLVQAELGWIRKTFNIVLTRTALELKGTSCLSLEEVYPPKKAMVSSRSFGVPVSSFDVLREAVSFHACVFR
ncbi:MAG: Y-family DNA polymerase [Alphaproteobacteria bacterium]|nr:Y-family DNA polymerase [Alphaproteobacteria bacterium]